MQMENQMDKENNIMKMEIYNSKDNIQKGMGKGKNIMKMVN